MNWIVSNALIGMTPPPPGTQMDPKAQLLQTLGMFAFFGIVFYVIAIRPQQKKAKEHTELLKSLKPGDKAVTTSGIIGIVVSVKDNSVTIRSGETKLEVLKSSIGEISERANNSSQS